MILRTPRSTLFPYTTLFRSFTLASLLALIAIGSVAGAVLVAALAPLGPRLRDRKSTRLNSSHTVISYAVFCLKKKIASLRAIWRDSVEDRDARHEQTRCDAD